MILHKSHFVVALIFAGGLLSACSGTPQQAEQVPFQEEPTAAAGDQAACESAEDAASTDCSILGSGDGTETLAVGDKPNSGMI